MAVTKNLPDLNEPLTEYEKALLEKLLADPTLFPAKFKAWLNDYVGTNATIHPDSMPSLAGEEWHEVGATGEPAFASNWGNYGSGFATAGFMKDTLGFVHLKGLVTKSTALVAGDTVFTLPAGYRPALHEAWATPAGERASGTTQPFVYIQVTSAGALVVAGWSLSPGEPDYHWLTGSFRAA